MSKPILIGHKGADAIVRGNTVESFIAAVEHGVELIELDVLRTPEGRLIVAHDLAEAATHPTVDLREVLDRFWEPPLDEVELDLDIKLVGREAEIAGAIEGAGLVDRAMVSTMEPETLWKLRGHEPDLRLGLTYPKTRVDWTGRRWAAPMMGVGLAALQRRYVKLLPRRADELSLTHTWVYHRIVTPALIEAARAANVKVMAWTVDDADRIAELAEMGVDGICTNDPRVFEAAMSRSSGEDQSEAADAEDGGEEQEDSKPANSKHGGSKDGADNDGAGEESEPRKGAEVTAAQSVSPAGSGRP